MMTREQIDYNAERFKIQMSKFIDFSQGRALMLNNADWLLDLNYVELLREVGTCFSVNNMLRAECYKQRMEKGLTFFEFNYMDNDRAGIAASERMSDRLLGLGYQDISYDRSELKDWNEDLCGAKE